METNFTDLPKSNKDLGRTFEHVSNEDIVKFLEKMGQYAGVTTAADTRESLASGAAAIEGVEVLSAPQAPSEQKTPVLDGPAAHI